MIADDTSAARMLATKATRRQRRSSFQKPEPPDPPHPERCNMDLFRIRTTALCLAPVFLAHTAAPCSLPPDPRATSKSVASSCHSPSESRSRIWGLQSAVVHSRPKTCRVLRHRDKPLLLSWGHASVPHNL